MRWDLRDIVRVPWGAPLEVESTSDTRLHRICYNNHPRRLQSPRSHHEIRSEGRGVAYAHPRRRRACGVVARAQRAGTGPSRAGGGWHARGLRDGAFRARRRLSGTRFFRAADVFGLQALRALLDVEFHPLAFIQCPVSLRLDGAEMQEHIFPGIAFDEAVAFVVVEPLDGANFGHFNLR